MKPLLSFLCCFLVCTAGAQNIQTIADGNNRFAFSLYDQLRPGDQDNLFYSPFSISTALAMTYAGAGGETARQISNTLNFQSGGNFHEQYRKLLQKISGGNQGNITLDIANGLWAQKNFTFLDSYFNLVKTNYDSELKNVDFINPAAREDARNEINTWVEKVTRDKIKDLLGPTSLDSFTRLVLVNAIYFYGDWALPFEKRMTRESDFYSRDNLTLTVPFMNNTGRYNFSETSDVKVIELPYKGSTASMLIFLPVDKDGLADLEKKFNYKFYTEAAASLQMADVALSMPKFTTDFQFKLGDILANMGMPIAFSTMSADFSGMTGKKDLYISEVFHQAFVKVDETGTEAAAATAVVMARGAPRKPEIKFFIADHPFIFLIRDNATGSILFMGRLTKPAT